MNNDFISSQPPVRGSDYVPSGKEESIPLKSTVSSPHSPKDTLSTISASSSPNALPQSLATLTSNPQLPSPKTKHTSLWDYLTALGDAKLDFQHVIQNSSQMDQANSRKRSEALLYQTNAVLESADRVEAAKESVNVQTDAAVNELQEVLDEATSLVDAQNASTINLEKGNAEEKKQCAALTAAYKTFTDGLKKLGIKEKDGVYTIPDDPKKMEEFNKLATDLNKAITTFNTYAAKRLTEVEAYNTGIDAYNAQVEVVNQALNTLIDKYGIPINKNSVPIAYNKRDTAVFTPLPLIPLINDVPAKFTLTLPSTTVENEGKLGPPPLPTFSMGYPKASAYSSYIYAKLYAELVVPAEAELKSNNNQLASLSIKAAQPPLDSTPDPFSSRKPLSQLLIPAALFAYRSSNPSEAKNSMLEAFGTGLATEKILAKELITRLIDEAFQSDNEQKELTNQLADKLNLLSIEQLSRHSRDSLLPSIQKVGPILASLPKDSPALAIVFGLSLAKSVQEAAQNGQTATEINGLMNRLPALSQLSAEQRQIISAGLTSSQLILAGKFLASSLGLPDLFANLLKTTVPDLSASTNPQTQLKLREDLKTIFTDQGYSEDQATFLANVGSKGVYEGTILAPPLATVSRDNLNLPVFMDSLTAALLLSPNNALSLSEAAQLAEKAASRTLSEGPFNSSARFRSVLEHELQDLGLKEISSEIPKQTILIPKKEPLPTLAKLSAYLTPLLAPHLGKKQAEELSHEVVTLLQDLPKNIVSQAQILPQKASNALLSEGLNSNLDLHALLSTLTNPAALFIFCLPQENIYQNKELPI